MNTLGAILMGLLVGAMAFTLEDKSLADRLVMLLVSGLMLAAGVTGAAEEEDGDAW